LEHTNQETRLMGIDYGEKRIGISLTDPLMTFAYPFTTLQNDKTLFKKLSDIIREKSIVKVILGLPSSKFKSSAAISELVKKLKSEIESSFKIDVVLWDEEYSSILAKAKVIESVSKKSKRKNKELIDQQSAAIILQEYLDSKK